jgi:hypothetical protein
MEPDSLLTAEEMLVESQLVAVGLLEPRCAVTGEEQMDMPTYATADAALPATRAIKAEIQRTIQTLLSFIERAHGLRMQGMVAEFIQPAPDVIMLIAVHAVQWDSRSSRGRLGTFTQRWDDFLNGVGPAPTARPATKRNFAPGGSLQAGRLVGTAPSFIVPPL